VFKEGNVNTEYINVDRFRTELAALTENSRCSLNNSVCCKPEEASTILSKGRIPIFSCRLESGAAAAQSWK
jgi:hypothetical protein